MDMKNLIFNLGILFTLVFTLSLVSAEVNVTYNVTYGIIEDNGVLTTSTTPVSGLSTIGYVCTSANCATLGAVVSGLTSTTLTDRITVTFPTVLQNANGYVVYFYKDGYIGWEQRSITLAGDGNMNSTRNISLSKMRTGWAPIMNLSVVNEAQPNRLIEINVTAGIDAQTYAAIQNAVQSGLVISENVNTTITLKILNETGSVVNTQTRNVLISYSGVQLINFDYTFPTEGSYSVNVSTDVLNELKIINSVSQSAVANIQIIQPNLTNYTYVLIQNLNMQPVFPLINESINFSYNWLANYVNASGSLFPVNASFYTTVTRNGNAYSSSYLLAPANSNAVNYTLSNFNMTFSQVGNYVISVRGIANSTLGNQTFESLQQLVFIVGTNSTDDNNGHIEDHNSNDDDTIDDDEIIRVLSLAKLDSGATNQTVIDLTGNKKAFNYKALIWTLLILIILLLILIAIVYLAKDGELD